MDIIRNVGIREPVQQGSSKITDTDINSMAMKLSETKLNRNSLPNILFKDNTAQRIANGNDSVATSKAAAAKADGDAVSQTKNDGDDEEECAISGRLEIRVIQQNLEPKNSPNRDESIYFDAVANGQNTDDKVSRKLVNKIYTTTVTDRNTEAGDGNGEQPTDETAFFSATTGRLLESRDDAQKSADVTRLNLSNSNPNSADGDNRLTSNVANIGLTDVSSLNDDNAADSLMTAANTAAKFSNVIGSTNIFKLKG